MPWMILCVDVDKSSMNKKHETQVSENRYIWLGDAEDQPPTVWQGDAETNAPIIGQ